MKNKVYSTKRLVAGVWWRSLLFRHHQGWRSYEQYCCWLIETTSSHVSIVFRSKLEMKIIENNQLRPSFSPTVSPHWLFECNRNYRHWNNFNFPHRWLKFSRLKWSDDDNAYGTKSKTFNKSQPRLTYLVE